MFYLENVISIMSSINYHDAFEENNPGDILKTSILARTVIHIRDDPKALVIRSLLKTTAYSQ